MWIALPGAGVGVPIGCKSVIAQGEECRRYRTAGRLLQRGARRLSAGCVQRRLQHPCGGHAIDHPRPFAAAKIGLFDQEPADRRGGQPLVPDRGGQAGHRGQRHRPIARRLCGRTDRAVHRQRQADHQAARAFLAGDRGDLGGIVRELAPRRRLPYGVARVSRTSVSASPMVRLPGSIPISRSSLASIARRSVRLNRAMPAVMVRRVFPAKGYQPMSLDPATVRRIAALARIRVDDAEIAQLQAELNGILGWIEQLNEVDRRRDRAADRRGANGTEDA